LIEILPHQWVPIKLVDSYELTSDTCLQVTPVASDKKRPVISHEFTSPAAAGMWALGLDCLLRAHRLLSGEEL